MLTTSDRFSKGETVKVYVGPDKTLYNLHKDLLCCRVPFFEGALKAFKEGLEGVVNLPEDDEHAFELFIDWLYATDASTISFWHPRKPYEDDESKYDIPVQFPLVLVKFYVLADKFLLNEALRVDIINSVLKCLVDQWHTTRDFGKTTVYATMSLEDFTYITTHIAEADPMYRLCMDIACLSVLLNPTTSELAGSLGVTTAEDFDSQGCLRIFLDYMRDCAAQSEPSECAAFGIHFNLINPFQNYLGWYNYSVTMELRYLVGFLTPPVVDDDDN